VGVGEPAERRGGLIVFVPEAEAAVRPWEEQYVPIWHLGMPAHVTLLFPFLRLDELEAAGLADLTALFAATPSTHATFAETGKFPDVVYLAPEPREWFIGLTEALSSRFGLLPYGGIFDSIIPHLTVARHPDPAVLAEIAASLEPLLPIETTVREIWLMEEAEDGHWHRTATFALGEESRARPVLRSPEPAREGSQACHERSRARGGRKSGGASTP
jgi:2'-5' RNA ligase